MEKDQVKYKGRLIGINKDSKSQKGLDRLLQTLRVYRCQPRLLYQQKFKLHWGKLRHPFIKPNLINICFQTVFSKRRKKENFQAKDTMYP